MIARRLAGLLFELLYGPAVPLYDWISRVGFVGEWTAWQRTVLRFIAAGPVLELGPGTGDLLPVLAAAGLRPTGVEPSARMLARARRKLAARGLDLPLVRGRAETLPLGDARFGAVIATFPSAYILRPATWREIARVLRPGGAVGVVLGGELSPDSPGRALRARAYRLLYGSQPGRFPLPHGLPLTLQEVTVPTPHGRAFLLTGVKEPSSGKAVGTDYSGGAW